MTCATPWPQGGRSFVQSTAALLLALACLSTPVSAYEFVSIKASQPAGARNGQIKAEFFKPRGDGPFPAVVLMHGCGGWQPAVLEGLHSHAMYFLDRGYAVLNLDSFGPRGTGGGMLCESNARLLRALKYRTGDAMDALRFLRDRPDIDGRNVFLLGQSNGGSVAINAAKITGRDGYRAVAAYYPWCGSLGGRHVKLGSPLIIFSGGRDNWVPAYECRHKVASGAQLKVIEYASAAHSFDLHIPLQHYLGNLIGADKPATQNSRENMLAFFNSYRLEPAFLANADPAMPLSISYLDEAEASWFEGIEAETPDPASTEGIGADTPSLLRTRLALNAAPEMTCTITGVDGQVSGP